MPYGAGPLQDAMSSTHYDIHTDSLAAVAVGGTLLMCARTTIERREHDFVKVSIEGCPSLGFRTKHYYYTRRLHCCRHVRYTRVVCDQQPRSLNCRG